MIHATRPLRVQELRYALAIEDNDEDIDQDGLLDVATITSFCAGLVIIDEQRGLFSLVHPTTQEYFDKHKGVLFPAAHENIAATCITYLGMKPFRDEGALDDFDAFYKRCCTCHFLGYAAVNWGSHAAMAGSEKANNDSISLLKNELARAATWQALQLNIIGAQEVGPEWPKGYDIRKATFTASKSFSVALHIAAYFGLIGVVRVFLELDNDVDQLDGTGRTPLHWAILGKQNKMLQFHLKHGANANAERRGGYRNLRRWYSSGRWTLPLTAAAFLDNGTAIEYLLHHGAEINNKTRSDKFATALSVALHTENLSATQVLMENGADVNLDGVALTWTVENGNLEFLKMAIDAGLSNYNIQRALVSAAAGSNYCAMVFLVEHGANANGFGEPLDPCEETYSLSPEKSQTPLVASAANFSGPDNEKSFQCFQYLMEAGASLDPVCARQWWDRGFGIGPKTTALHTAAFHGCLDMVRTLLERGADVNLSLGERHTALSSALVNERYQEMYSTRADEFGPAFSLRVRATVKLLVDFGANPKLCKDEEIQRTETLLQMSSNDCKMVAALQTLADPISNLRYLYYKEKSVRDSVSELKELIAKGASTDLCCDQDKQRIGEVLAW